MPSRQYALLSLSTSKWATACSIPLLQNQSDFAALQIVLYAPLALFCLKVVSRQDIPGIGFWDVARSVLIFLGEQCTCSEFLREHMAGWWARCCFSGSPTVALHRHAISR